MVTKLVRIFLVITLLTVAIAVASTTALASSPSGVGPDNALYPTDEWRTLNPGETEWFMFRDKGKGAQIIVDMSASDLNGMAFEVWTEGNTQTWLKGQKVEPVGRGSNNPLKADSLIWAGNFNMSGNCLVLVKNTGTSARSYKLSITGRDVYFPTAPPVESASRSVASPEVMADPAVVETSMAMDGSWMTLNEKEIHWFSFDYEGKNKDILIRMAEDIAGRAEFAVFTPAQYADKMAGKTVEPVGRSSIDPFTANSAIWFGSFPAKGTYHVEVTHTNQAGPAVCTLSIASKGLLQ